MRRILILTFWSYKDALIQTYTLPYVKQIAAVSGREVILLCLEHKATETTAAEKLEINQSLRAYNISVLFLRYHPFGAKQLFVWIGYITRLSALIIHKKVGYIHAWGTAAGGVGYLLSKLTGRRLVIDSYEPHAESMVENGTWSKNSTAFKILSYLERKESHHASDFIAVSSGMKQYALETYGLTIPAAHFFVKPSCVDLEKFSPCEKNSQLLEELQLADKLVCVYAGKLGGIYLDDEVFDFIKVCYDHWGDRFRFLMLTNASREEVDAQIKRIEMPQDVVIQKFAWHADVPKYMSMGDFALNPVKPVPTKRYCTSIKDGEYWGIGLPVVITAGISDDSDIIEKNKIGYVLKKLDKEEYKNAVNTIVQLIEQDRTDLQSRIRSIAKTYRSFTIAEKIYTTIYS